MTVPGAFPRTDELRLALVLNGGVSLAVWMGGVAFELNRLVRETHPVYRGLLELTGTAARIDVISGTSAGGINGAALALAQIHDQSLFGLRDVWLDTGGLEKLLHDPDDADLRSLLRGDEWFLPQIRAAFSELVTRPPAPPSLVPLSLSLTSTLLDGVLHKSLDDFGAEIEDTVHRAIWQFPHLDSDDAFTDGRIVDQLAFAARATASFPVAFAPAEFKSQGELFQGTSRLRVRTSPGTAAADDVFLMDGGILDNKPFDAALEAISRLPAEGNTRRVLAYVVPDPAAAAEKRTPQPDGKLESPTLAQAAWRSLVSIPASQSIAGHMTDLRAHNDANTARWRRIVGVVGHMQSQPLLAWADAALESYRARRVDGMIEYFIGEIERRLASADEIVAGAAPPRKEDQSQRPAAEAPGKMPAQGMRRATRQWIASLWRKSAQEAIRDHDGYWGRIAVEARQGVDPSKRLTDHWAWRLPARFDPDGPLLQQRWSWGLYALQFASELTIEVLRRTQRLHALVLRWQQAEQAVVEGPALRQTVSEEVPATDEMAMDIGRSAARETLLRFGTRLGDAPLKPEWSVAYEAAASISERRLHDNQDAGEIGMTGFVDFVRTWSLHGGQQPPINEALSLLGQLLALGEERGDDDIAIARALCGVLLSLKAPIEEILFAHAERASRSDIDEAVTDLRALHRYLYEPAEGNADREPPSSDAMMNQIGWRVLALEVFEVTACSRRLVPSAQAEIIQISARVKSAFGGSADPAQKLTGMQLAHFGAFYKRSWRANDWTFGCLDGIDRAVRIALNPDALQKRYSNRRVMPVGDHIALPASEYVERYLHDLAAAGADPAIATYLEELWQSDLPQIRAELAWLDLPATVPPPVLEHCAQALTGRLQMETLRRELPEIATSLMIERSTGAPPSNLAGEPLLARVAPTGIPAAPSPRTAAHLVRANLLGSETFAMQVGTDQLSRIASQGLATAHTALSSKYGGVNALNFLLKVIEWPLRIFYWLVNRLAVDSRTSVMLESLAWGVGAALVVAGGMSEKTPSALLAFGWALLAGAVGAGLLRSRTWPSALILALVAILLVVNKGALVGGLLVVVAFLLLLTRWGGVFAALIIIGAAAWWSAGGSGAAAAVVWNKYAPVALAASAPAPSASAVEQALRLEGALWPALLIGVLLVLAAVLRSATRPVSRH